MGRAEAESWATSEQRTTPKVKASYVLYAENILPEELAAVLQELAAKGLTFNQPDIAPFREKLRSAGFYAEWKGKYGEEAWALLEKSVGKLS